VLGADLRHHLAQGAARLLGRHASLLELHADDAREESVAGVRRRPSYTLTLKNAAASS
jgi:hypothetical protein